MEPEQSSLDRFLHQRAPYLMTGAWGMRSLVVQRLIGAACFIGGLGMLLFGVFGGVPDLVAGATGPLIAGVVNLIVPTFVRRRLSQRVTTDATMTPEAHSFLFGLLRKVSGWGFGWPDNHPMSHLYERRLARRIIWGSRHPLSGLFAINPKAAKTVLDPELFEILDGACREYNRIAGILETGHNNSSILKMSRQIQLAADESLFDVFHQAATLSQYPESAPTQRLACAERIRGLKELADHLEAIQNREQSIADRVGYSSTMDTVLEELRLDQLARAELTKPNEQDQESRA